MESVNINYTDSDKTKETNSWDSSGNGCQKYMTLPRTWIYNVDSNVTYSMSVTNNSDSSRVTHNSRENSCTNVKSTTQHFHHKKNSSNRITKYNLVEEGANKETFYENNDPKTLQLEKEVSTDPITSSDSLNSSKGEKISNIAVSSNETEHFASDNINHTTMSTEKDIVSSATKLEEKRRLRREKFKLKKVLRKQKMAVLREEEMLKKRQGPKDQKITIIDHSVFNRFWEKETCTLNSETNKSVCSDSEFPALGEDTSLPRRSPPRYQNKYEEKRERRNMCDLLSEKQKSPESHDRSNASQSNSKNLSISSGPCESGASIIALSNRSRETQMKTDDTTEGTKNMVKIEDKTTGRRPKRRDPIHLDINEILKVQETKHGVSVKQHTSKPAQKMEVVRYAGNILDSDNPERKRGKQREVPKAKKPSILKQIILHDRAKRKETSIQIIKTNTKNVNFSSDEGNSIKDVEVHSHKLTSPNIQLDCKSIAGKENESSVHSETHDTSSSKCEDVNKDEHVHWQLQTVSNNVKISENVQNINEVMEQRQGEKENPSDKSNKTNEIDEIRDSVYILNCQTSGVVESQRKVSTPRIHSRKFREYCDHYITHDILNATTALLEDIVKFHDRQFARSPLKASAKRRHVTGLKEVRRFLALRRIRLLVIAPDLERTSSSGGLDDLVTQLKEVAIANEVPYVFALGRRQLGYILKKRVPVSCVGVLNYDGTENNFYNLKSAVETAREEYKLWVAEVLSMPSALNTETAQTAQAEEVPNDGDDNVNKEVVASLLAKLTLSQNKDTPSPFLKAIERCTN